MTGENSGDGRSHRGKKFILTLLLRSTGHARQEQTGDVAAFSTFIIWLRQYLKLHVLAHMFETTVTVAEEN